ncbi:MAG: DNA translocase FtsK 4TM domain-containing protein, partial [Rickettsiales bacterium]|nr:DNA translocase FtsK 4TM domain-containing protein [Rickettsiales bacterium]
MQKFHYKRAIDLLLGISVSAVAIFLSVAILTYNKLDPSFNTITNSSVIFNKMGIVGAYIADLTVQLFGVMSFFIVAHFFLVGINFARSNRLKKQNKFSGYSKVIAFISCIVFGCALLGKIYYSEHYFGYQTYGGAIGYYIYNLTVSIPSNFLLVLYSTALLCSLYVVLDFNFRQIPIAVKSFGRTAALVSVSIVKLIFRIPMVIIPKFFLNKIRSFTALFKFKTSRKKVKHTGYENKSDSREKNIESIRKHIDELKNRKNDIVDRNQRVENRVKPALFSFLLGKKQTGSMDNYRLPTLDLLNSPNSEEIITTKEELKFQATSLLRVLKEYKINGRIVGVKAGPIITLHEFEPSAGTKSSRVIGCADDIARNLRVESARISVIPERNVLGIELPNKYRNVIYLKDILELREYKNSEYALPTVLGSDISGNPVIMDLAKAPHLLIAGTTGSGKSVCINTIILSLLYKFRPEECKLIMIDPKMLELSTYEGIPHLLVPVVTDSKKAIISLKWVVSEMENRYRIMSGLGVRNIYGYNEKVRQAVRENVPFGSKILVGYDEYGEPIYTNRELETKQMPFIVVFVDEMADLMITAGKEIETLVQRIAQMARAAGIHMVMAT